MGCSPDRVGGSRYDAGVDATDLIRLHATDAHTERARKAEATMSRVAILPLALAAAFLILGVLNPMRWGWDGQLTLVVIVAILAAIGIGQLRSVAKSRATRARAAGHGGLVFAVSPSRIALADDQYSWSAVQAIEFQNGYWVDTAPIGTAAAYGRKIGDRLRHQSGHSVHDIVLTMRDGSVVTFPFGSLLGGEEFAQAEQATRAVSPVPVSSRQV